MIHFYLAHLCSAGAREGIHCLQMTGFFLRVPSPLWTWEVVKIEEEGEGIGEEGRERRVWERGEEGEKEGGDREGRGREEDAWAGERKAGENCVLHYIIWHVSCYLVVSNPWQIWYTNTSSIKITYQILNWYCEMSVSKLCMCTLYLLWYDIWKC